MNGICLPELDWFLHFQAHRCFHSIRDCKEDSFSFPCLSHPIHLHFAKRVSTFLIYVAPTPTYFPLLRHLESKLWLLNRGKCFKLEKVWNLHKCLKQPQLAQLAFIPCKVQSFNMWGGFSPLSSANINKYLDVFLCTLYIYYVASAMSLWQFKIEQ